LPLVYGLRNFKVDRQVDERNSNLTWNKVKGARVFMVAPPVA